MMNNYLNIINSENNNLNSVVQTFFNKFKELSQEQNFLNYIENLNKLINSLIDICIKKKINYFVINNISFSSIKSNFIIHFYNVLQDFINPIYPKVSNNISKLSINDIKNIKTLDEWNNILLILFDKKEQKNKVSFNPTATEYIYTLDNDNVIGHKRNFKSIKINLIGDFDKKDLTTEYKIGILIKILHIGFLDTIKLQQTVFKMCQIISDSNIEYNVLQPYNFLTL